MIKSNSKSPAVSKRSQQNMSMDIKDLKNLISLYFSKLGNRKSKFLAMTMLRAHLN